MCLLLPPKYNTGQEYVYYICVLYTVIWRSNKYKYTYNTTCTLSHVTYIL